MPCSTAFNQLPPTMQAEVEHRAATTTSSNVCSHTGGCGDFFQPCKRGTLSLPEVVQPCVASTRGSSRVWSMRWHTISNQHDLSRRCLMMAIKQPNGGTVLAVSLTPCEWLFADAVWERPEILKAIHKTATSLPPIQVTSFTLSTNAVLAIHHQPCLSIQQWSPSR